MPRRHDARLVLWLVTGLVQILLLLTSSRAEAQVVFRASAGGGGEQGPAANAAPPKLAEQPMARMWYSRVTMQDAFAYMRDVSSELGIRQTLFVTPSGAPGRPMEGGGDAEVQLKGTLVYLTKGMVPVPVTISFRRVADEKEFRRLVLESRASFGDAATMVGSGDKYEVRMQVQQLLTSPQPAGEGGEDSQAARPRATIAIRIDSSGGNSGDGDAPRGLPAGDVGQISVLDLSTFYRFHDGIVYESQSPALHTMQLPKTASLTPRATEESLDFFADIDLSQIPRAFREVFWNTVKSQAGTFLQQYDDEPDEEYALRRRTGEFSLELTRAAILDVDRIRLSMKFARDGEPVRLELTVDAREDSNLAQQLGKVSGGVSRFQALRKQPSPLTIASAWQMPDNFVALLKVYAIGARRRHLAGCRQRRRPGVSR